RRALRRVRLPRHSGLRSARGPDLLPGRPGMRDRCPSLDRDSGSRQVGRRLREPGPGPDDPAERIAERAAARSARVALPAPFKERGRMRSGRPTVVPTLLAAWLFLVLGCVAANAHASLVRSDPVDGAVLDAAPSRLVLTFNEPVSPLVLRLVGDGGTTTDLEPSAMDDTAVVIDTLPGLDDGGYLLSWRVVSSDGHPIGGSVAFSVGTGGIHPPALAEAAADRPL